MAENTILTKSNHIYDLSRYETYQNIEVSLDISFIYSQFLL